jgi:hypothetical protein
MVGKCLYASISGGPQIIFGSLKLLYYLGDLTRDFNISSHITFSRGRWKPMAPRLIVLKLHDPIHTRNAFTLGYPFQ